MKLVQRKVKVFKSLFRTLKTVLYFLINYKISMCQLLVYYLSAPNQPSPLALLSYWRHRSTTDSASCGGAGVMLGFANRGRWTLQGQS